MSLVNICMKPFASSIMNCNLAGMQKLVTLLFLNWIPLYFAVLSFIFVNFFGFFMGVSCLHGYLELVRLVLTCAYVHILK